MKNIVNSIKELFSSSKSADKEVQIDKDRVSKIIKETEKMQTVSKELKAIAREIVKKSKETARVDTGRLKRSISYVVNLEGIITFTEAHYGQIDGNSQLLENIKCMFPKDEPYNYSVQDDSGNVTMVIRKQAE